MIHLMHLGYEVGGWVKTHFVSPCLISHMVLRPPPKQSCAKSRGSALALGHIDFWPFNQHFSTGVLCGSWLFGFCSGALFILWLLLC